MAKANRSLPVNPIRPSTPTIAEAKPVTRSIRPPKNRISRSMREAITVNNPRVSASGARAAEAVSRASSSRVPYSTPDGHTGSHARQPRHRSMWTWKASDSGSRRPSTTACMRCSRPLGESFSSPRRLYVGHAGRQKPQCTHGSNLSLCASIAPASSTIVTGGRARGLRPGQKSIQDAGQVGPQHFGTRCLAVWRHYPSVRLEVLHPDSPLLL